MGAFGDDPNLMNARYRRFESMERKREYSEQRREAEDENNRRDALPKFIRDKEQAS